MNLTWTPLDFGGHPHHHVGMPGTVHLIDDVAETSVMLLLAPECVDMSLAEQTSVPADLPDGHFDKTVDPFGPPSRWSEGQGHFPIGLASIPEGAVGRPGIGDARKARRTIAAIPCHLTQVHDHILEAFRAGKLPPIEKTTMRTAEEMEPYLKEPFTPAWRPIYSIRKMGL